MEYRPYFTPRERRRHVVRPGITGWAQIHGRNTTSWDERLERDIWYVDNQSILLDLRILAETIYKIIKGDGVLVDPRSSMKDLDKERKGYISIRKLEASESGDVANIFRNSYDYRIFSHTVIASQNLEILFRDILFRQDIFIGVFRGDEMVGALQARKINDLWHLNNFAVLETERGWGVADLLLQRFFDISGGQPTELFVDSRNVSALQFYRRHGYQEIERVQFATVHVNEAISQVDKIPVIVDQNHLKRYGVGYLHVDGEEGRIGFIAPAQLFVPDGSHPDLLKAALAYPGHKSITFPLSLKCPFLEYFPREEWERIRMWRE